MSEVHDRYAILQPKFLRAQRWCEIRVADDCHSISEQVHHMVPRARARSMVADVRIFAATCDPCHRAVTHNATPEAAAWNLEPFEFPAYAPTGLAGAVAIVGGEYCGAIVSELIAVAMGPGWVVPEPADVLQADIRPKNGNVLDARLANIEVIDR